MDKIAVFKTLEMPESFSNTVTDNRLLLSP